MKKALLAALGLSLILALTVSAAPKFDNPYDRVQELACERGTQAENGCHALESKLKGLGSVIFNGSKLQGNLSDNFCKVASTRRCK